MALGVRVQNIQRTQEAIEAVWNDSIYSARIATKGNRTKTKTGVYNNNCFFRENDNETNEKE